MSRGVIVKHFGTFGFFPVKVFCKGYFGVRQSFQGKNQT